MIWKVNANFLLFSEIYGLISVMLPLVLNINGFKDFRVCFRERRIILFCISITCHIELTFHCLIGRQLFKAYVIGICSIFAPKWTTLFLSWISLPEWTAFPWLFCRHSEWHFRFVLHWSTAYFQCSPAYSMAFSRIRPAYSMAFFPNSLRPIAWHSSLISSGL